ncbi:MAG: AbrB/MazE/SpoVT family DNA-binding domain-containing protein [Acidobacteria bacterium]|nr:AbrB/MazE/SpoVT family DNA-binding domain-containing protein [Acidobacteriota bacterium]MYH28733.1 AbrB/MazE/SpoVT family DNA-binding domain-containing protein [Acidobacteriota bacterium]MYK89947.1 AbrB/MazE/SpoVT family DNA-binding domain-containing protein [Acidobacteriota bacterium]
MPITLTVTAKGQITLRKEVLEHLGVRPGDKVDVDLLKDGRLRVRGKHGRPVASIFGMLKRPATPTRSIEELNEAAAAGWAGKV